MAGGSDGIHETAVPAPQTVVVTLPDEIDISNKGLVQAALARALGSRPTVVVADGTGTGFCDCAAIATLITAHHNAAAAGAQLRAVLPTALVRRVLELTGADQVLRVYPSLYNAYADGSASPRRHPQQQPEHHDVAPALPAPSGPGIWQGSARTGGPDDR